jgi:hypothetical protein
MSTYIFQPLSATVVEVIKDGFGTYKPRNMSVTVTGNNISILTGIDVDYDFIISTTGDDIIYQSQYVTGTTQEIADYLSANIFNSSGGSTILTEPLTLTAEAESFAQIYLATPTGDLYITNYDDDFANGAYAGRAVIEVSTSNGMAIFAGSLLVLNAGANDALTLSSAGIKAAPALVAEYADNDAAVAAGKAAGTLYRTGDDMKIVHA